MKISKKIIYDFMLNIIASALPIAFLQLIVLPEIAKQVDSEVYGFILTITAIISVITIATGNILNNVRLLMDKEYKKEKLSGDFNIILLWMLIISILIFISVMFAYNKLDLLAIVLLILYTILYIIQLYTSAEYRIKIEFKKIVYSSIFMTLGYIVGMILFKIFHIWELIYICGILFSLIYQIATTNLLKEPLKKTKLFTKTLKKTIILTGTSVLINVMVYLDRIILYPILGGENVTIYYVASMYGKMVSMVASPVSNVLLSYYVKKDTMKLKTFWKIVGIVILLAIVVYLVGILISKYVVMILYPGLLESVKQYINIANMAAIINIISTMIQPMLLSYCKTKWQFLIQMIHILAYVIGCALFVGKYQLIGFCYVSVVANILRMVVMIIIGTVTLKNRNSEGEENSNDKVIN